mmetsp:Transcript_14421/g.20580  ORF Transcript_14421/g.20580 Transcript_14421/m.20580 type:complete len:92 (+) Transcript_14421:1180-1455(+)
MLLCPIKMHYSLQFRTFRIKSVLLVQIKQMGPILDVLLELEMKTIVVITILLCTAGLVASQDCNAQSQGHKVAATSENKMDGSTAYCGQHS